MNTNYGKEPDFIFSVVNTLEGDQVYSRQFVEMLHFLCSVTVASSKRLPWALVSHVKNERAGWDEVQGFCKYYRCDIYEMKSLKMVAMGTESRNSCPKPAFSFLWMQMVD